MRDGNSMPRLNAVAIRVLSCEIAFFRDQARKERMKSNAIIALLLCIVTSSQPAFTGIQPKPTDDEPPATDGAYFRAHHFAQQLASPGRTSEHPPELLGQANPHRFGGEIQRSDAKLIPRI